MADSSFTFEEGEAVDIGAHGEHEFVYEEGTEVGDFGVSGLVFEEGTGLGGLQPRGEVTLSLNTTNSPVGETAVVDVDVDVNNNNDYDVDAVIQLSFDGGVGVTDVETITVPANKSLRLHLEWQTEDGDAGDYTATVESGIDTITTGVTVEAIDNPEDITYDVTVGDELTLSERSANNIVTGTVASVTDIRFIRARVIYDQEGDVYGQNDQGNWGLDIDGSTTSFSGYSIRRGFDEGGSYDTTGVFDLGFIGSSDLTFAVDDGDGTIERA